jgi:hypothetical protein
MPRFLRVAMDREPVGQGLGGARIGALGTLAGCVWLVHPRLLNVTFEGTEGALAALCWQVSIMGWATERSAFGSLRLGALLGVGTLARIDHLVLVAVSLVRPRHLERSLRRAARVLLPVATLWGSWLFVCFLTTGSLVPDSGAAKRLGHVRYFGLDSSSNGAWSARAHELHVAVGQLGEVLPLLFHTGGRTSRFSALAALVIVLVLAGTTARAMRRRAATNTVLRVLREATEESAPVTSAVCRRLGPVFLAAGALLPAYVFVLHHLRNWYAMPAQLAITVMASALCLDAARAVSPRWSLDERPWFLALTTAIWLAATWTEQSVWPRRAWQASSVAAASALVETTPPGARIGAFNAGILGAFASQGGRIVVNLDGVVNHGALRASEERTLTAYIADEHIAFIADYPETIAFAETIVAPGLSARLGPIASVPIEGRPGGTIGIWQVQDP